MLRQALAKNATVDIVGEAMLEIGGGGGRLYLHCYFGYCQVAVAYDSHIWKAARVTTILPLLQ